MRYSAAKNVIPFVGGASRAMLWYVPRRTDAPFLATISSRRTVPPGESRLPRRIVMHDRRARPRLATSAHLINASSPSATPHPRSFRW
jgi:hypothetical protein